MIGKLGFAETLMQGLLKSNTVPSFIHYSGANFSLRRSRQFGAETVWFRYEGRGLSADIQGEEGTDGGMFFQFDYSPDLLAMNDGTKKRIAHDINLAMRAQIIPCQVVSGNQVL